MEIEKQSNLNSNKKAEFRLTDEQLKFILAPKNRDIKVTACAGSGKTECALQFIKSAIDEGQDPRSISITTFNIQASVDMKKRAIQLMGKENANKIEIINFDKIIFKLYKQIKKIKSAINNELINNNKNNKQVIDITLVEKQYEVYLNLQDLSFTKYFQSKKLVVFDEFQDINQLHYDILMLFKKVGNSVLVVLGDEAQNIYEFRGSNFKYLNQIVEDVNRENKKIYGNEDYNMLEFKLTTNFRCSSKITDFANDIIRYFNFKDFNQNTMISFEDLNYGKEIKKCDVKPSLIAYPNYNNLVQDIIIQINVLIKNYGFSYKDFAIISPTTFTLYQVELFLQKYNYFEPETEIPFWSFIGKSKEFGYKYEYQADKIMILTGHKSKGLQWKVVFEVGMEDNLFPLSFLRKTEHDLDEFNKVEELKRLFYVMSTRTSQFLYISYISHNNNDQLNYQACRFLNAIDKNKINIIGQARIYPDTKDSIYINEQQLQSLYLLFEVMVNIQHINELHYSQRYIQPEYISIEKQTQLHKRLFSKQYIEQIYFNQSEEILFTYFEVILIEKTQMNFNKNILQYSLLNLKKKQNKYQLTNQFIKTFELALDQFLDKDLKINSNKFQIQSLYKVSCLYQSFKSRNMIYRCFLCKNPFYSMTKVIIKNLELFVDYILRQNNGQLLVLDSIEYNKQQAKIFDMFLISTEDTIFEINQSFKKNQTIEKQNFLKVLSKVAILKLKYGRDIKKIEFYNPIKGTILQIYLQNWTFHKDIINFIFQFQSKLKDSDQNISQDIQTQNCTQQTLQTVLVDQGDISQTLGNSLKIQEKTLKSQKDNLNIKEENSSEILRISQQYQNQLINQLKQQSSQSSFEDKMNFDAHMTKQNQNLHIENAKTSNKQQILINSKKNQKSYDSQQIDEKNNKFLNKLI
ncbi:UvrD/REP helicase family protein (macronuclear) [Tetrahymena thermophila SB210]|uniref:DNA 3'-5' helicase n=1 Tax=Tetrahymena thermophila (strain SB210) TaxID=312017 RepID=Q23JB9_TETTS|nr:UvrD/REP helicase family protein [Tetrahymena thermophila SB210]EAR96585.2 UvrD/REP helicase family protein [Tetrahymena thermophila SB210]|eukprot:XP_001016830.2 UvrD/REP helicase family protein [Tetrahymena thermophila SB210]